MNDELVVTVRLFTLIICALTMLVCIARCVKTDDIRARAGQIPFAGFAGIAWLSQVAYLNAPPSLFTWLLLANTVPCLVYLAILIRKGL